MRGIDLVLIALVILGAGIGAWRAYGVARGKRDCCSGDAGEKHARFKTVEVDRDPEHYAHHAMLQIQGMTCANCVKHVSAALESLGDTCVEKAEVGTVEVFTNREVHTESFAQVIYDAGYRLLGVE